MTVATIPSASPASDDVRLAPPAPLRISVPMVVMCLSDEEEIAALRSRLALETSNA